MWFSHWFIYSFIHLHIHQFIHSFTKHGITVSQLSAVTVFRSSGKNLLHTLWQIYSEYCVPNFCQNRPSILEDMTKTSWLTFFWDTVYIAHLIDWFAWLTDWLTHWFIGWFIHSFINALIYWLIDCLIDSLIHPFIDWCVVGYSKPVGRGGGVLWLYFVHIHSSTRSHDSLSVTLINRAGDIYHLSRRLPYRMLETASCRISQ